MKASNGGGRGILLMASAMIVGGTGGIAEAQTFQDLRRMSIDQLADVDVSTVTKSPQSLADAAASIYVIDYDDIERSGATTLPEALRLAPNLVVARQSASQYVISARGQSGNPDAQNFANKLLVLIDGRSVYTPLFSGVYWDMQDVLLADIDRIEVISGPGATLWGANAVNGVVNIITRGSAETPGLLVSGQAGTLERTAGLRYGGALAPSLSYRVYARGIQTGEARTNAGLRAYDERWRTQGGFRLDWQPSALNSLTLQGDAYQGQRGQTGAGDERIVGRNLLARWSGAGANGDNLQVLAYYDLTVRETLDGGGRFVLDTYDIDAQQSFALGESHAVVVGGGVRASRYRIRGAAGLDFAPPKRTLWLANAFAQDTVRLGERLSLVVGAKLEDQPFGGAALLPSARLAWKPTPDSLVWGAVSRAIRSATPFDRDVVETIGDIVYLTGSRDFVSEKLTAFELGTRLQPLPGVSLSVTGFHHRYDDLRSIEPAPGTFLPLRWGNGLGGSSWGVESWADWQASSRWRLSASYAYMHQDYGFDREASGLLGVSQLGSDPEDQATLRSSMDLGAGVLFDAGLRYVGPFPDPQLPAYLELDGRLGWALDEAVTLSITGTNLLRARHQEYPGPSGNLIPRQLLLGLQWRL